MTTYKWSRYNYEKAKVERVWFDTIIDPNVTGEGSETISISIEALSIMLRELGFSPE